MIGRSESQQERKGGYAYVQEGKNVLIVAEGRVSSGETEKIN